MNSWHKFSALSPKTSDLDENGALWVSDGEKTELFKPEQRYTRHIFWQAKPRCVPPPPPLSE